MTQAKSIQILFQHNVLGSERDRGNRTQLNSA
jgi:hypothetical protein